MSISDLHPMHFGGQLRKLMKTGSLSASTVEIPKHGNAYNFGDRDDNVYLVETGQIKTVVFSKSGKECLLSIYSDGAVFGELCLALRHRMEDAAAMKPTVLRRISLERLVPALVDEGLLRCFLNYLTLRLLEQQQTIANLVMMDSEHRLAAVLLQLARKLGKRRAGTLLIEDRITQEELSTMVGTTRSRVGYFLKRLRQTGIVELAPGSLLVVHEDRLAAQVDEIVTTPAGDSLLSHLRIPTPKPRLLLRQVARSAGGS